MFVTLTARGRCSSWYRNSVTAKYEHEQREEAHAHAGDQRLACLQRVHETPPWASAAFVRSTELEHCQTFVLPTAVFCAEDTQAFAQPCTPTKARSHWTRLSVSS